MRRLGEGTPLKLALDRLEAGEEDDEVEIWMVRWDKVVRLRGDDWPDGTARRPPQIQGSKSFPKWLDGNVLTWGHKLNAMRWFLHLFPRKRGIKRRQARVLNMLREERHSEENLIGLKQAIREI